ncbi:hypothetical protein RESH_03005 [Rhodopirellula europaea SH398]|uniref:Uncharacterized protein n=1 Tax=Rhodopirellula europaea SH398 TaxID=1263868 RepID=M5S4R4_9BACT|nr:hypothetical protein RESH_03005 [Rhodopirellula europaea SH398]
MHVAWPLENTMLAHRLGEVVLNFHHTVEDSEYLNTIFADA